MISAEELRKAAAGIIFPDKMSPQLADVWHVQQLFVFFPAKKRGIYLQLC
jgi:hypothetical protein